MRNHSVTGGALLGVRIVAALVSFTILLAGGFYWATFRSVRGNLHGLNVFPSSSSSTSTDIDGTDQNILIAGNDDRETATDAELAELGTTRDGGSINTDTMMVLHVPADGRQAFAISFPRDTYVSIPGYGQDRLNSAYGDGFDADGAASHDQRAAAGARLLIRTIQDLTGISIDHFAMVDLISFYRISKAIGGVRVCLNNAVDDAYSGLKLPKGYSTVEGRNALAFVRQRHGVEGDDLGRIKRQQYFLSQAFKRIKSANVLLNPTSLRNLIHAIDKSLLVDRSNGSHQGLDPLTLARQLQGLDVTHLRFDTIPTIPEKLNEGTDNEKDVLIPQGDIRMYVKKALGLYKPPAGSTDPAYRNARIVSPSTVTVRVLNGSGVAQAATTAASTLSTAGFRTDAADAPAAVDTTTIAYPSGMESQAKTLAQYVPGAVVQRASDVSSVTLTLGGDGRTARSSVPTAASTSPAGSSVPTPTATSVQPECVN